MMEEAVAASNVDDECIESSSVEDECIETYQLVDGVVIDDGVQHTDIEIKVEEDNVIEVEGDEEYEYGIEVDCTNYLQIATNEVDGVDGCQVSMHSVDGSDELTEQEIVSDGNFSIKSECDEAIEHTEAPCEFFMVSTVEEMRELINDYSERTSSHFVAWCKTKHFGVPSLECDLSGHRIQWHDDRSVNNFIQYDGIPHVTIGHYELHCQFGVDKSAAQKEKRRKMKEEGELIVKSRTLKTPTKKCGCPAKIVVKHIIRFPEFVIDKDTKWKRNEASAKLKTKLKENRGDVVAEAIILGRLPDVSEHKFHEILQGKEFSKEVVSRDLAVKAQEYFLQNKSNTEILDSLRDYVINEMFWNQEPPDFKRRKFFPTRKDIRNFNARVRHLSRFSPEEQECIRNIMTQAQMKDSNTNISFQIEEKCMNEDNDKPDSSDEETNDNESAESKGKKRKEERKVHSFVFCHQTPQQQRLIKRYSNVAYLVEVETIMTTKRILTYRMYAVVVQTNADFQLVGIIIVSKQRKEGLLEGLTLFREWNNTWSPKYLLVDFSEVIFDAVLKVFPDSNYFLNPTSCESKWLEFISTPPNNIREHSEEILTYLKNMQYSLTEDSLSVAAALLEGSEVWQKGEKLRTWFQTSWLHLAKKWVFGYRTEDLIITQHLKLSINDCICVYRDALYQSAKLNGFIELLQNITLVLSDAEYLKYIQRNNEHFIFYNQFRKTNYFSDSMQGIPITMLPYVEGVCRLAEKNNFTITHDQLGLFTVRCDNPTQKVSIPVNVGPTASHCRENFMAPENHLVEAVMDENRELSIDEQIHGNHQQIQGNHEMQDQQMQGGQSMQEQQLQGDEQIQEQQLHGDEQIQEQQLHGDQQIQEQELHGDQPIQEQQLQEHQQIQGCVQVQGDQQIEGGVQMQGDLQMQGDQQMQHLQIQVDQQAHVDQHMQEQQIEEQHMEGDLQIQVEDHQQMQGNLQIQGDYEIQGEQQMQGDQQFTMVSSEEDSNFSQDDSNLVILCDDNHDIATVNEEGHAILNADATAILSADGTAIIHADGTTILNGDSSSAILNDDSSGAILNGDSSSEILSSVHCDPSCVQQDNTMPCDMQNHSVLPEMKGEEDQMGNPMGNVNDVHNEVNQEREIEIKETDFGWIEYANRLCPGEYTISFGDSSSHPFCTCSHWLLYRLPCVHMFAVFCKVPGWRYDMLSPLYRVSPVLDIDYSCINYPINPPSVEQECQTYIPGVSVETQTNTLQEESIFESLNVKGLAIEHLLGQTKDFLQYINKMAFLFKDKFLHRKLRVQLKELVDNLAVRHKLKKENCMMKKESCMIFGELGNALKQPTFHKENGKPLKISTLNLEQIVETPGVSRQVLTEARGVPKIIPKTNNDITVSMIELPDGRNLESVLQALSRNNPSLKVLSASRVIKPGEHRTIIKPHATINSVLKEKDATVRIPSKIVTKNIAPNSDACEKPVVFRILPGATFNKGGLGNTSAPVETTVELDVNKALPIHLERTPMDTHNATMETSAKDFVLSNGKRAFPLPVSPSECPTGKKIKVSVFESLPELRKTGYILSEKYPMSNNPNNNQILVNNIVSRSDFDEESVLRVQSDLSEKTLNEKAALNLLTNNRSQTEVLIKLEHGVDSHSLTRMNGEMYDSLGNSLPMQGNSQNINEIGRTEATLTTSSGDYG